MDTTPMCDRRAQSRVGTQRAFIDHVCAPLFAALARAYPQFAGVSAALLANRAAWETATDAELDACRLPPLPLHHPRSPCGARGSLQMHPLSPTYKGGASSWQDKRGAEASSPARRVCSQLFTEALQPDTTLSDAFTSSHGSMGCGEGLLPGTPAGLGPAEALRDECARGLPSPRTPPGLKKLEARIERHNLMRRTTPLKPWTSPILSYLRGSENKEKGGRIDGQSPPSMSLNDVYTALDAESDVLAAGECCMPPSMSLHDIYKALNAEGEVLAAGERCMPERDIGKDCSSASMIGRGLLRQSSM